MDSHWASEHLVVIRTLMERSGLYRRALAPVMTLAGVLGSLAAVAAWLLRFESPLIFTGYWMCVGTLTAVSALLLVRQQAFKEKEAFWSPPTRRVVQALLPPFAVGVVLGTVVLLAEASRRPDEWLPAGGAGADLLWLPLGWIVLYGLGLHAAGFFTPRGIRLFGWMFIIAGLGLLITWALKGSPETR
jgi:hypothetical protein